MALQNPHFIDLLSEDPTTGEVILGMLEPRPWDGSDQRIFELQEKVNAYLSFALDGEMEEQFPAFRDRRLRLQLESAEPPDAKAEYYIGIIREQIGFQGIGFVTRVVPEMAEEGCTCGNGGCGEHREVPVSTSSGCCGGGGGGSCGC